MIRKLQCQYGFRYYVPCYLMGVIHKLKVLVNFSKTIAQLVMYQYRKITGHSSSVTLLRRHVKERKTLALVYIGLRIYAFFHMKTAIQCFFPLGLSFSYNRCLSICNNVRLKVLKKCDLQGAFIASYLTLKTFTFIAKDNIYLHAISTKVEKHFYRISMKTMQLVLNKNQRVK